MIKTLKFEQREIWDGGKKQIERVLKARRSCTDLEELGVSDAQCKEREKENVRVEEWNNESLSLLLLLLLLLGWLVPILPLEFLGCNVVSIVISSMSWGLLFFKNDDQLGWSNGPQLLCGDIGLRLDDSYFSLCFKLDFILEIVNRPFSIQWSQLLTAWICDFSESISLAHPPELELLNQAVWPNPLDQIAKTSRAGHTFFGPTLPKTH